MVTDVDVVECVRFSQFVYQPESFAKQDAAEMGYQGFRQIRVPGSVAYIFASAAQVVVAFRGTETSRVRSVLRSGRFRPARCFGGGLVHRGFWDGVNLLWPELERLLLQESRRRVIFTGHSKGGAEALIAAARCGRLFKVAGRGLPAVVTFGAPLVGTLSFARGVRRHTSGVVSVTNNNDPVPHVPLWPFYCRQSGMRIHITSDRKMLRNPSLWQLASDHGWGFLAAAWRGVGKYFRTGSVIAGVWEMLDDHDHFLNRYREACDANLGV